MGEVALNIEGNAFLTVSNLPVTGPINDTIFATYNGNDVWVKETKIQQIEIKKASVQLTLQSSINPSIAGQQEVALTVTLIPAPPSGFGNLPTGTVDVAINLVNRKVPVNPQTGKAVLNTSDFAIGTNQVAARYFNFADDENYGSADWRRTTQTAERVGSSIFYFLGDAQSTQVNTNFPSALLFNITELNPKLSGAPLLFLQLHQLAPAVLSTAPPLYTVKTTALGSFCCSQFGIFRANGIPGTYTVTSYHPGFGNSYV